MTTTDERAEQDFDATSDDMIGRSREEVESHSCWIFPESNTSNQSYFETSTEISELNSISFNCRSATHCKISVLGVGRSTAPEGISGVLGEYYTIADGGWDLIWYNNDNVQSYFIHLTQQTRFSTRWRPRNFRLTRTDYLVYWHKIIKPVHSNLLCCTLNAPLRRFGIAPLTSLSNALDWKWLGIHNFGHFDAGEKRWQFYLYYRTMPSKSVLPRLDCMLTRNPFLCHRS